MNVSAKIGAIVSAKLATLHELQTVYGTEDLENLLEVLQIDGMNARAARAAAHREKRA